MRQLIAVFGLLASLVLGQTPRTDSKNGWFFTELVFTGMEVNGKKIQYPLGGPLCSDNFSQCLISVQFQGGGTGANADTATLRIFPFQKPLGVQVVTNQSFSEHGRLTDDGKALLYFFKPNRGFYLVKQDNSITPILLENQEIPSIGKVVAAGTANLTRDGQNIITGTSIGGDDFELKYNLAEASFSVIQRLSSGAKWYLTGFSNKSFTQSSIWGLFKTFLKTPDGKADQWQRVGKQDLATGANTIFYETPQVNIDGVSYALGDDGDPGPDGEPRSYGEIAANDQGVIILAKDIKAPAHMETYLFCSGPANCRVVVPNQIPNNPGSVITNGSNTSLDLNGRGQFVMLTPELDPRLFPTPGLTRNLFFADVNGGTIRPIVKHYDYLFGDPDYNEQRFPLINFDGGRVMFVHYYLTFGNSSFGSLVLATRINPYVSAAVNGAFNGSNDVSPRQYTTLYGNNLSSGVDTAGTRITTKLAGASVTVCGLPAIMVYSSPTQINIQTPSELPTDGRECDVTVSVEGKPPMDPVKVKTAPTALALFQFDARSSDGKIQVANLPIITDQHCFSTGCNLVGPGSKLLPYLEPAKPGWIITAWGNGCGVKYDDKKATPQHGVRMETLPTVTIDGIPAAVGFAGLAPNFGALCQFNVRVPGGVHNGEVKLSMSPAGNGQTAATYPLTIAAGK